MGSADVRPAAAGLLRERAAGSDGGRSARRLRCVLWHVRWTSVRIPERRRHVGPDRAGLAGRTVGRGSDTAMIRVVVPAHLRKLAEHEGEIELAVDGPVTPSSILDALEARYPQLRGTVRDHVTKRRRPFVRFFACQQD